jgi:hypothetical protein
MSNMLGSARRARQLNNLFAVWKCALDLQDAEMMGVARRAIDAMAAGKMPRELDMIAIRRFGPCKSLQN